MDGVIMDELQRQIIRGAKSIEYFCQGDDYFNYGRWSNWYNKCLEEGKLLDPAPFKKTVDTVI